MQMSNVQSVDGGSKVHVLIFYNYGKVMEVVFTLKPGFVTKVDCFKLKHNHNLSKIK